MQHGYMFVCASCSEFPIVSAAFDCIIRCTNYGSILHPLRSSLLKMLDPTTMRMMATPS